MPRHVRPPGGSISDCPTGCVSPALAACTRPSRPAEAPHLPCGLMLATPREAEVLRAGGMQVTIGQGVHSSPTSPDLQQLQAMNTSHLVSQRAHRLPCRAHYLPLFASPRHSILCPAFLRLRRALLPTPRATRTIAFFKRRMPHSTLPNTSVQEAHLTSHFHRRRRRRRFSGPREHRAHQTRVTGSAVEGASAAIVAKRRPIRHR